MVPPRRSPPTASKQPLASASPPAAAPSVAPATRILRVPLGGETVVLRLVAFPGGESLMGSDTRTRCRAPAPQGDGGPIPSTRPGAQTTWIAAFCRASRSPSCADGQGSSRLLASEFAAWLSPLANLPLRLAKSKRLTLL